MDEGWSKYVIEDDPACANFGAAVCLIKAWNERAASVMQAWQIDEPTIKTPIEPSFPYFFNINLGHLVPYFGRMVDGVFTYYTVASLFEELGEERIVFDIPSGNMQNTLHNRYMAEWFAQTIRAINKLLYRKANYYLTVEWSGSVNASSVCDQNDLTPEAAYEHAKATAAESSYSSHPWHRTEEERYEDPHIFWRATVLSTAVSPRLKCVPLAGQTRRLKGVLYAGSGGYAFDPGSSGLSEGANPYFEGDLTFDNDGYAALPEVPGESLTNYPTSLGVYAAYSADLSFTDLVGTITGDFKFIGGS